MKSAYTNLMQSKYFNPAFNSAIFDGPVRIYFAQIHEPQALKIYFSIQQKFAEELSRAREMSKLSGANILIMLYPTKENFSYAFEAPKEDLFAMELWNDDLVFGLNGLVEDAQLEEFLVAVRVAMENWSPSPKKKIAVVAEM